MKLNCKAGDLAIMVKSVAGNEGKIMRCVNFLPKQKFLFPGDIEYEGPAWEVDVLLKGWKGCKVSLVPDEYLRPIRDPGDDATDETLEWLPVPTKQGVPA